MGFHILIYTVGDDYVEKRAPLRGEHLRLAREAHDRGELLFAGAFADPIDGAALVFKTDDRATVERFVHADPYVTNGLVREWKIRRWTVVVGEGAEPV